MNDSSKQDPDNGPSPETEPENPSIKEQYTSHWDMDYLPRKDMEALMARNRRQGPPPPRNPEQIRGAQVRHYEPQQPAGRSEPSNYRPALLLVAAALALFVAGAFILRL